MAPPRLPGLCLGSMRKQCLSAGTEISGPGLASSGTKAHRAGRVGRHVLRLGPALARSQTVFLHINLESFRLASTIPSARVRLRAALFLFFFSHRLVLFLFQPCPLDFALHPGNLIDRTPTRLRSTMATPPRSETAYLRRPVLTIPRGPSYSQNRLQNPRSPSTERPIRHRASS